MGARGMKRSVLAGAVLVALGVVAGCGAGGAGDSGQIGDGNTASGGLGGEAAGDGAASRPDEALPEAAQGGPGAARDAAPGAVHDGVSQANRAAAPGRAVIRRGEISIVTKEMNRARLDVEDLLGEHGGYIAPATTGKDGRSRRCSCSVSPSRASTR